MPTYSMSIADTESDTARIRAPRALYLDMYTSPGTIYESVNLLITVPETFIGSGIPTSTICTVKIVYVGAFSSCIQQTFINDLRYNQIQFIQT